MSPCQTSGRFARTPPRVRGPIGVAMENLEPRTFLSISDPDPTFGNGGAVTLPFVPNVVSLGANGDIIAVGGVDSTAQYFDAHVKVADVASNGSLRWQADLPIHAVTLIPSSVLVQPDGRVVVGGSQNWGGMEWGAWLARFTADGKVDPTFNSGVPDLALELFTRFPVDMVDQPNGQIVACGGTSDLYQIERVNSDGSTDNSLTKFDYFSSSYDDYSIGTALAMQPDGKILMAGTDNYQANYRLCITRFNPDGTPDATFGGGGTLITKLDLYPSSVQLMPGGDILVASRGDTDTRPAIVAIRPNGKFERLFGTQGIITAPAGIDTLTDFKVQPDGTFLVTGTEFGQPVVARFTSAGALDGTFGYNGILEGPAAITGSGTPFLQLTSDNKLVEWFGGSTIQRWVGLSQPQPAVDTLPPIPTLSPLAPVVKGARRFTFSVTYSDLQSGVSAASIQNGSISVYYGHHRWLAATLLSVTPTASQYGSAMVATYSIRPPDGRWTSRDNATYSIELAGGQVADNDGNATPQTLLGTFEVSIIRRRHVRHRGP